MAAVVVGDEPLLDDLRAGLIEPAGVADRIGLAPPHRCISAEPALFGAGPGALADGHQQPAGWAQPPGDAADQGGLRLERHVDYGVQADARIAGAGREFD